MFTVKRTKTSLITHNDIYVQKYEYDELYDALNHMERLRKEDAARYEILVSKYPSFFADSDYNKTSYHYTFEACLISCEVIGILEDAEQEFYVKYQLMTTQSDNCKGVNNNEKEN